MNDYEIGDLLEYKAWWNRSLEEGRHHTYIYLGERFKNVHALWSNHSEEVIERSFFELIHFTVVSRVSRIEECA